MSGKDKVAESNNRRTESGSLRSSVSDSSLTSQEVEPEASPQSFAALKAAYDFMLPQFKALQTENRSLHKEKEELRKRLTDRETPSLDMSTYSQDLAPDDLRSKGHAGNRSSVVSSPEEQCDTLNGGENVENCRVSPCGGLDSAINLNDGSSLTIERSVREERVKWLSLTFQLLFYIPEDKLQELPAIPGHCLEYCKEYASRINHQGSDAVIKKLGKLKTLNGSPTRDPQMRTRLVIPQDVGYQLEITDPHSDMENARGSPMGKSLTGTSDEDPSDEDIYTSGLPGATKRRGKKMALEDDDEEQLVLVDNAVDILEKCASFIHQSLEAHTLLVKKIEENQKITELSRRSRSDDTIGSYHTSPPDLPPPPLPNRGPTYAPAPHLRPSPRRVDHIRQLQQLPSAASDPGRASSAMSQLALDKQFFSDPVAGEYPRYSSPKKSRRPRSVAEIPTPLQELSVKYPPLPYGAGNSYSSRNYINAPIHTPPDFSHHSPVTIDQNSFQFDDGHTYNPCGPPENDFRGYETREEDDLSSWTAARNPDILYQERPASPPRFPRSDPSKRFIPNSSEGIAGESYGQRQLPRSSDRIYDMGTPSFSQFDTLTAVGFSEPGRSTKGTEELKQQVKCPICDKKFDPGTPEVARTSHVNLHFENERDNFEIIE